MVPTPVHPRRPTQRVSPAQNPYPRFSDGQTERTDHKTSHREFSAVPSHSFAVAQPPDCVRHTAFQLCILMATSYFSGALLCLNLDATHPRWKHFKTRSWQRALWPQDSRHRPARRRSRANLPSLSLVSQTALSPPPPPLQPRQLFNAELNGHSCTLCHTDLSQCGVGTPSLGHNKTMLNHLH